MSFNARPHFIQFVRDLQNRITVELEKMDGEETFREDTWDRPEGGGGWSRMLSKGKIFEKAGVNVSEVFGPLPDILKNQVPEDAAEFYATGISLVIHPESPLIPTTHANYRYIQVTTTSGDVVDQWFGGGADLTPYYLDEEDAVHFHREQKKACDSVHTEFYAEFKENCDKYFFNSHRGEARGIGGIFYDHLRPGETLSGKKLMEFAQNAGNAFLPSYTPIVNKHAGESYTEDQKYWQELRRGRYVEFNLIHDKGTLFGLKTKGRIESILMSLPPTVRWDYNVHPEPGSPEHELIEVLKNPRKWI